MIILIIDYCELIYVDQKFWYVSSTCRKASAQHIFQHPWNPLVASTERMEAGSTKQRCAAALVHSLSGWMGEPDMRDQNETRYTKNGQIAT